LVAAAADRPYNYIIGTVSRCDERRPDTGLAHVPYAGDRRWIGWIDAKGGKITRVYAVSDVCALFGSITCRCIDNEATGKMQRSYRRRDATEVAAINQIRIAVLTERNNQAGWRCTGHIDN